MEYGRNFGVMLAQTLAMLVLVCGLAIVTLRAAARLGLGRSRGGGTSGRLEVIEELVIGPRQSVLALRAGGRVIVAARTPTTLSPLGDMSIREWEARRGEPEVGATAAELDEEPPEDGLARATDDEPSPRARSFAELLG